MWSWVYEDGGVLWLARVLGCAEDGLLEEEEMSQLSGRTLDLRNSAALLKLARMSVDATALQHSAQLADTNCPLSKILGELSGNTMNIRHTETVEVF